MDLSTFYIHEIEYARPGKQVTTKVKQGLSPISEDASTAKLRISSGNSNGRSESYTAISDKGNLEGFQMELFQFGDKIFQIEIKSSGIVRSFPRKKNKRFGSGWLAIKRKTVGATARRDHCLSCSRQHRPQLELLMSTIISLQIMNSLT
ncbi:hypothetical protein V6N12_040243 [Hibiscus sabdariffa]|uniref:Uncharacterized protein n=1 Tax=Hibiscus sabdariffa TaxID=183260 RepID=A0ABR2E345_9ROSI